SVLAAWGRADDDIWLVGGSLGAPGDALIMHWDGHAWQRQPTGRPETLWWVSGTETGTDVWMVGEHGLVLRWDGTRLATVPSGAPANLYGVWVADHDDVWIVGGIPGPEAGPDDLVLHWDGSALAPVAIPPRGAALFKVWGASAHDFWISGEGGTLWRHT